MLDWFLVAPVLAVVAIAICIIYAVAKRRFMVFSIMFACVIVFILQMTSTYFFGAVPWYSSTADYLGYKSYYLVSGSPMLYTIITSMFVHSGITHLVFNIIALLMLGMALEERIGTYRWGIVYFLSGIFATLFFTMFSPYSRGLLIGASGAFCGILGAFTRLYPRERVSLFMFFVILPPLPLYILSMLFLGLETIFAAMGGFNLVGAITGEGGHVAHAAHIGGFIFGLVIAPWVMRLEFKEPGGRSKKVGPVDMETLRKLALTEKQKEVLAKIEAEDEPDVRRAWIEELARKARCPECGRKLEVTKNSARCGCGGVKLRF